MDNQSNQDFKPGFGTRLKSFFVQSKRVWLILRKPTGDEFKSIAKISALGILAIGAVGFLIADMILFFK
jgi:protein transport protein SEC61 subunit gamma and related proteins